MSHRVSEGPWFADRKDEDGIGRSEIEPEGVRAGGKADGRLSRKNGDHRKGITDTSALELKCHREGLGDGRCQNGAACPKRNGGKLPPCMSLLEEAAGRKFPAARWCRKKTDAKKKCRSGSSKSQPCPCTVEERCNCAGGNHGQRLGGRIGQDPDGNRKPA